MSTCSRLAWIQNALGKKTYYAYNDRGQVTNTWGDADYPIENVYDSLGQMTTLKTYRAGSGWTGTAWPTATTGTADTTTWTYDASSGLVTAKTFADSNSVAYAYTTDGKLSTRTWARQSGGQALVTTYAYDANTGEQTGIDYSDSTQDITFSYTRTGQKYQVTDSVGTRTFAYNAALQPTTETITGGLYSKTLTNNYATTGIVGRYTGVNISTEYSQVLAYDTYGRQNTVSDGTDTFTYAYLASSDLVSGVTRPNNLTTDYAYEANRNLVDYVENKYNATSASKYDYTNDAIGRRTGKSRTGSAFATADSITIGYNDRSEVTSAVSNNIAAYNYGFTFDNIGNRGSFTVAGTSTTYTADNLNQYTAITQGSTINPTYDNDGCMLTLPQISGGTWNNTWNGENRLAETYNDTVGKKLEFKYDYMGRRVEKKVYTGSSTTSWTLSVNLKFVYDGYKLIEILDGQNSDAILQKFLWNGEELLSVYDVAATATYYYFADANKNIGQLMDSSGNIVAKYEYSPFGVQTLATGTYAATNPFRFSSEYYDSETQLVYYNYRYYSPVLGRWLSRDPIEEEGGYNLYGFIDNNPADYWDELGLWNLLKWFYTGDGNASDAAYRAAVDYVAGDMASGAMLNRGSGAVNAVGQMAGGGLMMYGGAGFMAGTGGAGAFLGGGYLGVRGASLANGGLDNYMNLFGANMGNGDYIGQGFNSALGNTWGPVADTAAMAAAGCAACSSGSNVVGKVGNDDIVAVSRWGRSGLQPDDWIMNGDANILNYIKSGKWDPFPWNEPAKFSSGQTFYVPRSSVSLPQKEGILGIIKSIILEQKQYKP